MKKFSLENILNAGLLAATIALYAAGYFALASF